MPLKRGFLVVLCGASLIPAQNAPKQLTARELFYAAPQAPSQAPGPKKAAPKPAAVKPAAKEVQFARQLIESMTHSLDLGEFKDDYRLQVEELIESKRKGKKTVTPKDDHDDEPLPRTINLMDALKKSLASSKHPKPQKMHRKSA